MGEFNCGRDRDFDLRVCDIELLCVGTRGCAQEAIGGLFFADRLFKDHSCMDSSDLEYHWIGNHSLFVWYGAALSQRRSTTAKPSKGPILALALVLGTFTTSLFHSKWRGEQYARSGIPEAPLTQVLFESEKDKVASLGGKLIFDLDRYVLLYIEIDPLHPQISGRLVAIPHEKIKWIQIPPLSVEQKPIPAETSPRPPETIRRRVLASPVESPTPAETSPRPPATIQHNILASPVESPAAAETSPRPPEIIHRKILGSPIESPLQLRLRLGRPGQHTTRFWRVRLSPPELQPSHR